jgi:hypothetical protein
MGPTANSADTAAKRLWANERRSARSKTLIPVFVYGYRTRVDPFHEQAYASVVSENGGLLVMNARVQRGQPLLITNRVTQEERACRVIYAGEQEQGQRVVAVEFTESAEGFWRLTTRSETDGSRTEEQHGNG